MTSIMENMRDCTFKSIMMDESIKEYMCYILNVITKISMCKLLKGRFLNVEYTIEHIKDKKEVSDIIYECEDCIINLEANYGYYEGLFAKNNAYYQKLLSNMYERGISYLEAKRVIQLNIDNFSIFKHHKDLYLFVPKEIENNEIFIENDIERYYLDLKYLERMCKNKENLTKFERYCLVLTAKTQEELKKIVGDDEVLKRVYKKVVKMNSDEKLIGLYDKELEDQKMLNTRLEGAIAKGIEQGLQKGILETAQNLIKENVDINLIQKVTGLSKSKIKTLL